MLKLDRPAVSRPEILAYHAVGIRDPDTDKHALTQLLGAKSGAGFHRAKVLEGFRRAAGRLQLPGEAVVIPAVSSGAVWAVPGSLTYALAQSLAVSVGRPLRADVLSHRPGPKLRSAPDAVARAAIAGGSYQCRADHLAPRFAILVDDAISRGSTTAAMAEALKSARDDFQAVVVCYVLHSRREYSRRRGLALAGSYPRNTGSERRRASRITEAVPGVC